MIEFGYAHLAILETVVRFDHRKEESTNGRKVIIQRVVIVNEFDLTLQMPNLWSTDVKTVAVQVLEVIARGKGIVKNSFARHGCNDIEISS